jgi:hypothetical protein
MSSSYAVRLVRLAAPEVKYFVFTLIFATTIAICSTVQPVLIGMTMDKGYAAASTESCSHDHKFSQISTLIIMIFILEMISSAAQYGCERSSHSMGNFIRQRAQVPQEFCSGA